MKQTNRDVQRVSFFTYLAILAACNQTMLLLQKETSIQPQSQIQTYRCLTGEPGASPGAPRSPCPPTPPTTTTLSRLTPYNSTALHEFKGRKWQTSETLQDVESFSPSQLYNPLTAVATANTSLASLSGPAYIHTGTSTGKVGLLISTQVPALVKWACLYPHRYQHW